MSGKSGRLDAASGVWSPLPRIPSPVAGPDRFGEVLDLVRDLKQQGMTLLMAVPLVLSHYVERFAIPKLQGRPVWLPLQSTSWAVFGLGIFLLGTWWHERPLRVPGVLFCRDMWASIT